jgi:hypothetical protein
MTVLSEIGDKTFFAAAVRLLLLFLLQLTLPVFNLPISSSPPLLVPTPHAHVAALVRRWGWGGGEVREVFDVMLPSAGACPHGSPTQFGDEIVQWL